MILVTSSIPGEGKSFIAANTAISLASRGKRVILLGLDLRAPRLDDIFTEVKIDKYDGIVGYLTGKNRCKIWLWLWLWLW